VVTLDRLGRLKIIVDTLTYLCLSNIFFLIVWFCKSNIYKRIRSYLQALFLLIFDGV
jgi:hypothetical protein